MINRIPKQVPIVYSRSTAYILPKAGLDAEDLFIGDKLYMQTFCGYKSHNKCKNYREAAKLSTPSV